VDGHMGVGLLVAIARERSVRYAYEWWSRVSDRWWKCTCPISVGNVRIQFRCTWEKYTYDTISGENFRIRIKRYTFLVMTGTWVESCLFIFRSGFVRMRKPVALWNAIGTGPS
jgi:hypothetical protein